MKSWIEANRLFIKIFLISLGLTILAGVLYYFFGHAIIERIYSDSSHNPEVLRRIIEQTDRSVYNEILPFPILNLIFYFFIYKIFKFLLLNLKKHPVHYSQGIQFRYDWLVASGFYLLCTYAFFQFYFSTINTALIGPAEDNLKYIWNIWWANKALFEGYSLKYTNMIFFPEGTSLLYNDYSWYNLLLSIPLAHYFGNIAAYNILVLSTFVLTGLGGFFLIKYLVKDSIGAIVGGFILAFNPWHYAHALHHLNISSIQFIPFFVLFFIRSIREKGRLNLFLAILFFLLTALCDWNYLIFNIFFMILGYIYLALKKSKLIIKGVIIKSGIIIGSTLLILSPWLIKMVILAVKNPGVTGGGHSQFVSDLAGFFIPHYMHLLSNYSEMGKASLVYTGNLWESVSYLGIIVIVLILLFFKKVLFQNIRYFLAMAIFMVLSMGTYIHILGQKIQVVLPHSLLAGIPVLANVRAPNRYMVFVYLFLAIITAGIFKYIQLDIKRKTIGHICMIVIVVLMVLDYWSVGRDKTEITLPECYECIIRDNDNFGILELPGEWPDRDKYMAFQTIHERPIVQGIVPRKFSNTLIDSLNREDYGLLGQQLIKSRVKYIVVYKENYPEIGEFCADSLYNRFEIEYEDSFNVVFRTY